MTTTTRLFTDDTEAYVAESIACAREMQFQAVGENPAEESEWREVRYDPRKFMTMKDEDGTNVTKTIAQWIADNGPGFLWTTEE